LADADSDEWPSDSDASDDSDSDSDDDVDVSALPKGRAFWVKQAPTDDGKAKREERKAAKQEESLKKSKREKVVDLKAKVCSSSISSIANIRLVVVNVCIVYYVLLYAHVTHVDSSKPSNALCLSSSRASL
jgi:hypothetical protein